MATERGRHRTLVYILTHYRGAAFDFHYSILLVRWATALVQLVLVTLAIPHCSRQETPWRPLPPFDFSNGN